METKDQPLEAQLFSEVVLELNIARKNVSSYPKGHPQIETILDKAFGLLKELLSIKNEFTLGVAKDALMADKDYLDKKNPVFKDFALSLYRKGIASVTFTNGLVREELLKFNDLISSNEDFENLMTTIKKVEIKNIKIKVIDYRAFQVTEEERLNVQQKPDAKGALWDTFVRGLLEDILDTGEYDEIAETQDMSSTALAERLNKKSAGEISQSLCEKTIARFLSQIGESSEERTINLGRLTDFISNLKPELKKQFLSGTFKYLEVNPDLTNDILSEFPEELIIDTLKYISEKDTYVPPSILSLLKKLTDIGQSEPILGWARIERETLGDLTEDETREKLMVVFKEDTLSSDYRDQLTGLIAAPQAPETTESAEKVRNAVGRANIEEEEANIIFEILETNISCDEFSRLIWKLREMSTFFLDTGQFNTLANIYDVFTHHTKSENKMRAEVSNEAIQFFHEKDFMEEVINGFNLWGKAKYIDISMLIRKVGTAFIPLLFDVLSKEEEVLRKKLLLELLSTFGTAVTSEAIKRVKNDNPYFIRNLIIILRQSGDKKTIPDIQRFIKHADTKVQIEALRALLHLQAPGVSTVLKDAILSKNNEISYTALFLAGVHKVTDVIDLLLYILKKMIFWGIGFEKKEACVKALGEIGNPAALPGLSKTYKATSPFNRKTMKKLKMSIIRSIEKYPFDEAVAFLETHSTSGKSGNDPFKKACTDMLNKILQTKVVQNG